MLLTDSYQGERFTLNMGLDHADFFRTLPAALGDTPYSVEGLNVTVGNDDERRVVISLGPEQQRRIALISIVNTDVSFSFDGYDQAGINDFMSRFMARYQRGGG